MDDSTENWKSEELGRLEGHSISGTGETLIATNIQARRSLEGVLYRYCMRRRV